MVQIATPYLHPETRVYYLRRQIPKELRPAFGGKSLFKRSLETKDVSRAATLFTAANAELERQFEEARARLRLTGARCRPIAIGLTSSFRRISAEASLRKAVSTD